jgi:hypothetical protein
MAKSKHVYTKSISRKQKLIIGEKPHGVIILSPYITSKTAESVIKKSNSKSTEIYVSFKSEIFASGGSSISTLRKIIEDGYKVYHLEKLHAKVVLTKNMATIGSQNLTTGGTRNYEASYIIDNELDIHDLRSGIENWTKDRILVTLEMVNDMAVLLLPMKRRFQKILAECNDADIEIIRLSLEREKVRLDEEKKKFEKRDSNIRKAINSGRISSIVIPAYFVSRKSSKRWYNTIQISPSDNFSFRKWRMGKENIILQKRRRILMVNLNTHKLSWPALNKTQITQYGKGLDLSSWYEVDGIVWNARINCIWDDNLINDYNLEVVLSHERRAPLTIKANFTLDGLNIVDLNSRNKRLKGSAMKDEETIKFKIMEELLNTFWYTKNRYGMDAELFLKSSKDEHIDIGQNYLVKLHEIEGKYILSIE